MAKRKKSDKLTTPMPTKTFKAQVNCTCKRKCADRFDVLAQKDIFEKYYNLNNWSNKTEFLRSIGKIRKRKPIQSISNFYRSFFNHCHNMNRKLSGVRR